MDEQRNQDINDIKDKANHLYQQNNQNSHVNQGEQNLQKIQVPIKCTFKSIKADQNILSFLQPTKNPQQVFIASKQITNELISQNQLANQNVNNQQQQDDSKSQSSQHSINSRRRKGSFLQRLSQRQQSEEQKMNLKKKQDLKAVFLQNVDYKATKQQIELVFQDCAKIARITILKDQFTNHPKGCAYILFQSQEGVQRALSLSGVTLRNRIIKVHRKRTNLPGVYNKGGKKDQLGGIGMNILGMMQNFSRNSMSRGRGRGRGR